MKKLNLKKEFHDVVSSINRKFMIERCKLYKVSHRKNEDTLETLCVKYLRKLDKMKPWEIPDDEYGNAGFINPDRVLEDDAIRLTLARLIESPLQEKLEEIVMNRIKGYIEEFEFIELIEKYKKYMPKK